MEDEDSSKEDPNYTTQQLLRVLEVLKQASLHLQSNPSPQTNSPTSDSSAIKALLELETESESILSNDPNLSTLSTHLSTLKSLIQIQKKPDNYSVLSFLARKLSSRSISRLAGSIGSEIQAWIDRETVEKLFLALQEKPFEDEERLMRLLTQFECRVSQGFDRELQDLILKSKLFALFESVLSNGKCSKKVREHSAFAIAALIRFNKDVFVGEVFMGSTVEALITMSTPYSMKVLCELIRTIKSPLVDEIDSNGEIPKIILCLSSHDMDVKKSAYECVLEIGYFGRREAIEAMIKEGVVEKLVTLQTCHDAIDNGGFKTEEEDEKRRSNEEFSGCVARFAVQIEVGEGLRHKEKRVLKQEILVRVRKTCDCDAQVATIVAEVLWGSSAC